MMSARRWIVAFAGLVTAAAAIALALAPHPPKRTEFTPSERPKLLLLTTLPLMFGDNFSLAGNGSPLLRALAKEYRVVPVSTTAPAELAKARLLMMAQPMAQAPDELVALDQWVRNGGRLLLFADPQLEWPSNRPLGDPLRPPSMFMDTGLLAHWGLRLDAPDRRGPVERMLGDARISAVSPGRLVGRCDISSDQLVARCALGKGRATIVADADLLNGDARESGAVVAELARLNAK